MFYKLFFALIFIAGSNCQISERHILPYNYLPGYRGTVRRVLGNTNPVWFEASSPRECEDVPDQVNAGKPPRDICATAAVNEQVCICIKRAGYNNYEPICGECRDPCALKFVVDRYSTSPSLAKLIGENDEDTKN